jgi:DNA invertase Pin-like site-specific DNA recombinase
MENNAQINVEHQSGRAAYSYVRFSSKIQERGASLLRQTELSEQYVKQHNLILDDTLHLQDLGVSAFHAKNAKTGALAGFLLAINTGRVVSGSLLLVENLDRLSRAELSVSVALFLQIVNSGIDIVTLADGKIYTQKQLDMTNLIISIAILSRGHEESATKSFRVSDAYRRKVVKARELDGKFRITRVGPAWLRANDQGGWDIIPEYAAVVQEIYRLYEEGFGKWRIAGILNERGLKSFSRGKNWNASYIANILTSPAVVGSFRPGHWIGGRHRYVEGQDIPNYFPPVINKSLFERCYTRIKGRNTPAAVPGRIHLLSGLVWCGNFNERCVVWGTSKSEVRVNGIKRRYRYYYFVAKSIPTHRKREYSGWNIDYLERSFLLVCLNLDWKLIAEASLKRPRTDWAGRRQHLEKRTEEIKKEIGNLYLLAARGDLKGAGDEIKKRELEQTDINAAIEKLLLEEAREKEAEAALAIGLGGEALMRTVLLDGGDQDSRIRLREEIRKRVQRIDIFALGFDLVSKIEREVGVPLRGGGKVRCYKVTFANGTVRWVVPTGKKDAEVKFIYDENVNALDIHFDTLPQQLKIPVTPGQHRGRKKYAWPGLPKPSVVVHLPNEEKKG